MSSGSAGAVVLVHGGFVDGSGWQAVHDLLTRDGYRVAVVQNPTLSLEDDAAVTRRAIDSLDGPVVLVGHSYGGAVITEAGHAREKGAAAGAQIPYPQAGAKQEWQRRGVIWRVFAALCSRPRVSLSRSPRLPAGRSRPIRRVASGPVSLRRCSMRGDVGVEDDWLHGRVRRGRGDARRR